MSRVLEQGDIQFWFRPTVQPAEADHYELGVQSLFAIMCPAGGAKRRLRIGRKRMPASSRDRFWVQVERVGTLQHVLGDIAEAERYSTKTRGERYQPAARLVASGTYEIVQEEDHVRLSYRLDHVEDDDAPPVDDASHLVLFEATAGSATWTTTGDIHALDEEGAEIVLVGAKPPVSGEHAAQDEVRPHR